MVCTFFGHRDLCGGYENRLEALLTDLIENKNVTRFYVGNEGSFDYTVRRTLGEIKRKYPHIDYAVVLAYPTHRSDDALNGITIYPEGLESVPPRYAINKRNLWMIEQADYVVVYVKVSFGGAARCKEIAEKKGKIVFNLADYMSFKIF